MIKLLTGLVVTSALFTATPSFADGTWAANHPRRAEVNDRLANQNQRVNNGVRNGTMTPGQASQVHREDHAIRNEERADAAMHGGHITKPEQRQINHQENQVSGQIYRDKH
ncbi:MAG TPA: hypothetical protein VH165_25080 [Kofleriaceae bacterium]|jgi:hypothetical protein|nr:hypothetical protein [Kofleriaceae bacterium]